MNINIDYSEAYLIGYYAFPRLTQFFSELECIDHADAIQRGFSEKYSKYLNDWDAISDDEVYSLVNPTKRLTSWDMALEDYVNYYLRDIHVEMKRK